MISREQVDQLEKLTGQAEAHHVEFTALAKKSPNDAVNQFKLKLVNATIVECNQLLGETYLPFDEFEKFDSDDVPSNSDVTLVLAQYSQALEKMRSDNIFMRGGFWYYEFSEPGPDVKTKPPARLSRKG